MGRIADWVKRELREAAPAACFFFCGFQLVAFTDALMLEEYGLRVSTFMLATVAALVAAKVVLVLDALPFVNRFAAAPLVVGIAWKTLLFLLLVGAFKYLEHLLPLLGAHENLLLAHRSLFAAIEWPRFWAVLIWLVVLFFGFCTMRELGRVLGRDRLVRIFTQPQGSANHLDAGDRE
jgi:hypothetical protein